VFGQDSPVNRFCSFSLISKLCEKFQGIPPGKILLLK
jgi:hypothetical protein